MDFVMSWDRDNCRGSEWVGAGHCTGQIQDPLIFFGHARTTAECMEPKQIHWHQYSRFHDNCHFLRFPPHRWLNPQ